MQSRKTLIFLSVSEQIEALLGVFQTLGDASIIFPRKASGNLSLTLFVLRALS
jgi:hypothetical protein